ncbi:hypothetical protein [Anoxybacteroides rupiense]|uniref:Uncharacterized protein n=1 Tax=Anoxybacteroides rupiense TaxID=311460 RepID=A0ABD5IVM2_9BACL|nr:hypothetical protein [Anoxybacillus rupiensis]MBB3907542.1 hypothetical protein [Anoxybacillus rupiensis]MED5051835.1 hypothetical protein [Anoxybacillus rupiensis]
MKKVRWPTKSISALSAIIVKHSLFPHQAGLRSADKERSQAKTKIE